MKIIAILTALTLLSGCAGFNMSLGVGYRKIPPETHDPVFTVPAPLKFALTPAQIELILSFLGGEAFNKLIEYGVPKNNVVYLGFWWNISVDK